MQNLTLHQITDYSESFYFAIRSPLMYHDFDHIGYYTHEDIGVYIKDKTNQIQGGILGQIGLDRLYIQNNWVHKEYRNQGVGSILLYRIEEWAKAKGMRLAWLTTTEYLALDFYKKRGYQVFATLPFYNKNPAGERIKYEEYFMQKELV